MRLSVIVAVHNESRNIVPFYERAKPVLESLRVDDWDITFVNDASEDDSLSEILKLRELDRRVRVITLARRFGYHAVLLAGLTRSESDLYAMVDVDCEDPPELLVKFYEAIKGGAQVAYGVRSNREEPAVITLGRKFYYLVNRSIADGEFVMWMAEFAMITRQVRDAILVPHTTFPFLRAELGYVGFKRVGIAYLRAKRQHGKSHYNILNMTKFAVAGILSSSTFLLRFVLYLAVFIAAVFPLCVLVFRLNTGGVAMLAALLSLYFLLVSVPLIGLYLARTYKNVVSRPVFVIDQEQTFL
jgi:glycosyltransferase involved in cell wall biosynthesis